VPALGRQAKTLLGQTTKCARGGARHRHQKRAQSQRQQLLDATRRLGARTKRTTRRYLGVLYLFLSCLVRRWRALRGKAGGGRASASSVGVRLAPAIGTRGSAAAWPIRHNAPRKDMRRATRDTRAGACRGASCVGSRLRCCATRAARHAPVVRLALCAQRAADVRQRAPKVCSRHLAWKRHPKLRCIGFRATHRGGGGT
jgi:hypothetical protein